MVITSSISHVYFDIRYMANSEQKMQTWGANLLYYLLCIMQYEHFSRTFGFSFKLYTRIDFECTRNTKHCYYGIGINHYTLYTPTYSQCALVTCHKGKCVVYVLWQCNLKYCPGAQDDGSPCWTPMIVGLFFLDWFLVLVYNAKYFPRQMLTGN